MHGAIRRLAEAHELYQQGFRFTFIFGTQRHFTKDYAGAEELRARMRERPEYIRRCTRAKLSPTTVMDVRVQLRSGRPPQDIARANNVTLRTIQRIDRGETWFPVTQAK